MSTLLRLSAPRLKKAVARAGMQDGGISIDELRRVLERRGMSDRDMHRIFLSICAALEPPSCFMTHCRHFGGSGKPMNCRLERVPGRCSIPREFKQRQAKREAKAAAAAAPKDAA